MSTTEPTPTVSDKVLTVRERREAEENSADSLRAALEVYLAFPTPPNYRYIIAKVQDYPSDWMNGRERLEG